jgi:hypothetical protein
MVVRHVFLDNIFEDEYLFLLLPRKKKFAMLSSFFFLELVQKKNKCQTQYGSFTFLFVAKRTKKPSKNQKSNCILGEKKNGFKSLLFWRNKEYDLLQTLRRPMLGV